MLPACGRFCACNKKARAPQRARAEWFAAREPIPPGGLQKEHRRFATTTILFQPIAVYEDFDADSTFAIEWPADLTVMYQSSFFQGYVLNRASGTAMSAPSWGIPNFPTGTFRCSSSAKFRWPGPLSSAVASGIGNAAMRLRSGATS